MTGNLLLADSGVEPRHLRASILLDDGTRLLFTDARRFGQAVVLEGDRLDEYFGSRLGVEPLSAALTAEELCRLAAGRRVPLKSFLLDQAGVAGIGNIYADEALHRAELHPLSPAGSMKPEDCERLREGIVATLEAGLRSGGASVDDYRDARGERGAMQDEFLVHTREGKACPRCGAEIRRVVVAGRSTYFCPSCQRRLRRRPRRRRAPRAVA
jgi:formamidopyrimidine-DNA glycosylase